MFNRFRTAALSALVGFGTLAGMPAFAQDGGVYIEFGDGYGRPGVHVQHREYRERWGDDRRDRRRGCSAREAMWKADRMGIRRARVVDVSRRTITVAGRDRGRRAVVTFARAPRCPILR